VDIKPTTLMKGQELYNLLVESNCKYLGMNSLSPYLVEAKPEVDETQEPSLKVKSKFSQSNWYKEFIFYMKNLMCPPT
jgi:hypothetical protein